MGKHTTTQIIFAPLGSFSSDAIKPENIHLAICLDDIIDNHLYGFGIDSIARQKRLEAIMIKHHGESILDTHNAWQITVSHEVWNNKSPMRRAAWHACCVNNPSYRKMPANVVMTHDNNDWLQENAMMSGMAFGVQGYNDTMGY